MKEVFGCLLSIDDSLHVALDFYGTDAARLAVVDVHVHRTGEAPVLLLHGELSLVICALIEGNTVEIVNGLGFRKHSVDDQTPELMVSQSLHVTELALPRNLGRDGGILAA